MQNLPAIDGQSAQIALIKLVNGQEWHRAVHDLLRHASKRANKAHLRVEPAKGWRTKMWK